MNAQELRAAIAITNNGYLFAPTGAELAAARANPDQFKLQGGTIYLASDQRTADVATAMQYAGRKPRAVIIHPLDDYDYEGAILARQGEA